MSFLGQYRIDPKYIKFNDIRIEGAGMPSCYEQMVEHILEKNKHISLYQIQEGIKYGWYYFDADDRLPHIEINEYNKFLWFKTCNEDFNDLIVDPNND